MTSTRVGAFEVTRIEENLRPGFTPEYLFPDWEPEILKEHAAWLLPRYYAPASNQFIASIHSWLIRTRHHTLLVDTCCGNHKQRPDAPRFHLLDTPYLERLRAAGVAPEEVDYVLCTHLHVDHVGWNTRWVDGRWVPTFPRARYLCSRAELEHWDPDSNPALSESERTIFEDSIRPVLAAGLLQVVDGMLPIEDGLFIEPAPGHTPGQVVLRVLSQGQEGLFSGDVLHHPLQVYRPHWSSRLCVDPVLAAQTRQRVLAYCADSGCRLLPAHFGAPHLGWVRRQGEGFRFEFDDGV